MAVKGTETLDTRLLNDLTIVWRSAEALKKSPAMLRYELGTRIISVQLEDEEEPKKIHLRDVNYARAKDYLQGHDIEFGLIFVAAGVQHCCLFPKRSDRDVWCMHLEDSCRARAEALRRTATNHEIEAQAWTVQSVEVADAMSLDQDIALELKVAMHHPMHAPKESILQFRKGLTPDAWRTRVSHFQKANHITATEGSSLYRLAKALLSRDRLKDEVQSIIDRIDSLHIDRLLQDPEAATAAEIARAQTQANEELQALQTLLLHKCGEGTGPRVVAAIFKRSTDKLKVINEQTAVLRTKALQAPTRSDGLLGALSPW